MSGICGWVGAPEAAGEDTLERMLGAIAYRGDTSARARATAAGATLGYRFWRGRPGKSAGIERDGARLAACAGTFAPAVPSPARAVLERTAASPPALGDADGAFAFAVYDEAREELVLGRDPFGVRSLYYAEHGGRLYFATELKQLLAIPTLPVEIDHAAIHKYLTFSFVPGEAVPVRGVRRVLPGHLLRYRRGALASEPYFQLTESIDDELRELSAAARRVRRLGKEAVARRLNGEGEVGLFLSGGLDSSVVGLWLKEAGAKVRALSLDFGEHGVEREQAREVAAALDLPLELVPVTGEAIRDVFWDVVTKLDLPFGDAVTAPQYLLGRAAKTAGLTAVFNGEGGDQLFGGWTSKPMIAAELFGHLYEHQEEESREETYLRSYHRFYGLEDALYSDDFKAAVGGPGQRRAHLAPYLGEAGAGAFLNRVRLADISLKGSQNILPRAERMTNAFGLDVRVPLFDRRLAEASFRIPPELKLHGACEKYVLKVAVKHRLPEDIVWRRKYGMSVPATDYALGPLEPLLEELLGERALAARGMFRPAYVRQLREGHDVPSEHRKRRLGERLWALAMLEGWLRVFIDRRGKP
ncbi:MAG TPA: asparagine synthase-related protein [Kofleriaceae bacterium]|nr:asparagine synthase-related protein [Kofleriaceae bacterium]